jgi:LPS sulfotransferase NodH
MESMALNSPITFSGESVVEQAKLRASPTMLGMKLIEDGGFVEFPCHFVQTLDVFDVHCWRIGLNKQDPNVLRNQTESAVCFGAVHLQPGQMAMHPGPAGEVVTARVEVHGRGRIAIVAEFESLGLGRKPIDVAVSVNGVRLWRSVSHNRFVGCVDVDDRAAVDFEVGVGPGDTYGHNTVGVEFSLFALEADGGGEEFRLRRLDDGFSNLSTETAQARFRESKAASQHSAIRTPKSTSDEWTVAAALRYLDAPNRALIASCTGLSSEEYAKQILKRKPVEAERSYALCFTPRSGSTMFGEVLSHTKALGYPLEYLVEDVSLFFQILRTRENSQESYLEFIRKRSQTPNGVFGIEIDFDRFAAQNWEVDIFADGMLPLYLTRKDILGQAVSLFRAVHGGAWCSMSPVSGDVNYDRHAILEHISLLLLQMRNWEQYFKQRRVTPVRIYYEDVVKRPSVAVSSVARALNVSDVSDTEVDLKALAWGVVSTGLNKQLARNMMAEGGEIYGYAIIDDEDGVTAVLAGLDPTLLPQRRHWRPIAFRATDRGSVTKMIETALAKYA